MNPLTHLFASWTLADAAGLDRRERVLVTLAGILPDADGFGIVVDFAAPLFGRDDPALYFRWHHVLLHGLAGALLIPALLALAAKRRLRALLWGIAAVHLHLLCDVVGSRGPTADDIWPIPYLAPLSEAWTIAWSGQWALDAAPNVVLTIALIAWALRRAVTAGRSPAELGGAKVDQAVVGALRARFGG